MRSLLRAALLGALALAVLDLVAFRRGWWPQPPAVFAAAVALVLALAAVELVLTTLELARPGPSGRLAAAGRALLLGGIVAAGALGFENWLRSVQGFVVLVEGERVPLLGGAHLAGFERGALADARELDVQLGLARVKLRPGDGGGVWAETALEVTRAGAAPTRLVIGGGRSGVAGPLLFHPGAFGYAPRVVVLKGDETVFDGEVPFRTQRESSSGLTFEGDVAVEAERLAIQAAVSIDDLDEAMRGHPRLEVDVVRDGLPLGSGTLLPGHFADLPGGYRVGFAGARKWAEIDVSRRTYSGAMKAAFAVALAGALLWGGARLARALR